MAILKYGPGITLIRNEHSGFTFQSGRASNSCGKCQSNDRKRYANQTNKQVNLMKCTREWRNMSPATKAAWSTFAATYPQPCKKDSSKFLSGYQLFLKRNQYLFLNEGISEPFIEAPLMQVLALATVSFSIEQTENCADVTESYIHAFGIIPAPGDTLFLKVIPMAVNSGQMFPVIEQQIVVNETYLDGMFLSLDIPPELENIVFSLYLSLPINPSVIYAGTKTRYMGCFTTKTFISLTDSPDSYVGQAGKVAAVKGDESGLEFITPAGGGLTCSDLPMCPIIISMDLIDSQIKSFLLNSGLCSWPPIKLGLLYNQATISDARGILPIGWILPSKTIMQTISTSLGGDSISGGKLKEFISRFFVNPNLTSVSGSAFAARGSGYRTNVGPYSGLLRSFLGWTSTAYNSGNQWYFEIDDYTQALSFNAAYNDNGLSIRAIKTDNILANMIGNNGIEYRTCRIGNYVMTLDNLAETKFRNGDIIPIVPLAADWTGFATPKACYPDGNILNVNF